MANATPESYHSTTNNSTRWFPVALAEYIENENLNGTNFDILININTDSQIQWYYGLDGNTPADKTDFLSTMLHEIAHGLGFADSYSYNTTTKKGSTQYNYFDELIVKNSLPTAFSLLSLANNSTELGTELVSNDLYIMGTRTSAIANGVNPKIYAPTTWVDGTSIAHLDEESYPANDNNSLMTPALGKAEAIHSPGEITLSILEDMGWSVASLITINEPNASSYWVKGSTYQIQWSGNHEILINIDVLKKDSNGDYVDYDQITDSYTSIPGENSPYTWNIPSSYPVGEYKIKMLNEINGYGLSESFHITETASGGPQNTVYFYQRDGQNQIGKIQVWEQNSNFWSEGSYAHSKELPVGSGFSVRSKPGFVTGTTKRFSHMSESYPDVTLIAKYISHSDYIVRENEMAQEKYQSIYLYLKNAGNATVLSNSEGIDGIGSVGFKDPWFYDDTSDPKGTRNRGTSAIWHSSSYFNLSTSSSRQGVFLGQGYTDPTKPYYSVKTTSPQLIPDVQGKDRMFYFQNWESSGATFQNANSLETAVVFNQANATVKAVMKGTQLTNTSGTFNKNNQNKIVRTDNGNLHMVYESMGKVWYEMSTDNGNTWVIANEGLPLSGSKSSKLPSIDYKDDSVIIVWQENVGSYDIKIAAFSSLGYYAYGGTIFMDIYLPYSSNTNPVVSWDSEGRILVVWKRDQDNVGELPIGIVFSYGSLSMFGGWNEMDFGLIPNTNSNSINPTLTTKKTYSTPSIYHLTWQENWTSVKYCKLSSGGNSITVSDQATISTGSGYPTNYYPSITTSSSGNPIVAWVGSPYYGSSYTKIMKRAKGSSGWNSYFGQYGSNASYPQINMGGSTDVVAWTESSGAAKFVKPWGGVTTFGESGSYIQLANSSSINSMYGSVQNNSSSPYTFTTTSSVGSLSKVSSLSLNKGRGFVITKDSSQFFFIMGDVALSGEGIGFAELPSELIIKEKSGLNKYLLTEPFQFSDSDELEFSLLLGVSDSIAAKSVFRKNEKIKFSFKLIEDGTNKVLGKYEKFVQRKDDILTNESRTFKLDGKGIGNKLVKLKMIFDTDIKGEYTLLDIRDNTTILPKMGESAVSISYAGELEIKDYTLSQNYPNPFNPSTIIKYQIPNDGFVSIKVYDITGQEVATLVNQVQAKGRYEISFPANGGASSLSSGVYLYRLTSGSFTKSMKMLLIK